jgi:hypothetical protein
MGLRVCLIAIVQNVPSDTADENDGLKLNKSKGIPVTGRGGVSIGL